MEFSLEWQSTIDAVNDAMMLLTPDLRIERVNKAAERMFGKLGGEILGRIHYEVVHGIAELPGDCPASRLRKSRTREQTEVLLGDRHFLCTVDPILDERGELKGIVHILRDITERKLSEERVRRRDAYNRSLIEASVDPLVTIGSDGKLMDVNSATERFTGRTRLELIGTDFADYFTDPERARAGYREAFEKGEIHDLNLDLKHRDGRVFHVLYNASVFRDESGSVLGVFATARDITRRLEAEQELERSTDLLNRVQSIGRIGGWVWDVATQEGRWTDETYRIHEMDPQEHKHQPKLRFAQNVQCYRPEDQPRILDAIQRCVEDGEPYELELPFTTTKGRRLWIRTSGRAVREEGRIVRLVGEIQDITSHKQAQIALQESEQKFAAAFESNAAALAIVTLQGRYVEVNRTFCVLLGYSRNELLGRASWELGITEPGTHQKVQNSIDDSGGSTRYEIQAVTRAGKTLTLHTSVEPIILNGVLHRLETNLDITEQKKSQKELQASEEKYRSLVEQLEEGIQVVDSTGRVIFSNPSMEAMLGYGTGELTGKRMSDFMAPETFEMVWGCMRRDASARGKTMLEIHLARVDGSPLEVKLSGSPLYDHSGNVTGFLAAMTDISSLRLAEEARRKSEVRFRTIFEHAPIGVNIVTPDGRPLVNNPAMQRILGRSDGELCGNHFDTWTYPDDVGRSRKLVQRIVSGESEDETIEKRYVRKDGSVIWTRTVVTAVRDEAGGLMYSLTMVEDITNQRRVESELGAQRERLYHQDRIVRAGEIATSLAHELNQPLTGILGCAQALKRLMANEHPELATLREILEDIIADSRRAGEIIHRLRSFLKREEKTLHTVEARLILQDVVKLIGPELSMADVELNLDVPSDLPRVIADPVQIQQVVVNLVTNARQAMERQPSGRSRMGISVTSGDSGTLRVCVMNNGPAIPFKSMDRLFEPFFTLKPGGMGLGLAICRSIVEGHGGRIWAENMPEGGVRFCFTLPTAGEDTPDGP